MRKLLFLIIITIGIAAILSLPQSMQQARPRLRPNVRNLRLPDVPSG